MNKKRFPRRGGGVEGKGGTEKSEKGEEGEELILENLSNRY